MLRSPVPDFKIVLNSIKFENKILYFSYHLNYNTFPLPNLLSDIIYFISKKMISRE